MSRLWQRSPSRPVSEDAFSRPSSSTTTQPALGPEDAAAGTRKPDRDPSTTGKILGKTATCTQRTTVQLYTWVKHMLHICLSVCVPTTVDEGLQQLLLGQALVHFHPHYVTAEPLRLLLGLDQRTDRGKMGARCHGNKGERSITRALGATRPEEKVNERRAFPNAWLSAAIF